VTTYREALDEAERLHQQYPGIEAEAVRSPSGREWCVRARPLPGCGDRWTISYIGDVAG